MSSSGIRRHLCTVLLVTDLTIETFFFKFSFAVTSHHFVESLVLSVLDQMTLPMGFKARVDAPSPVLYSHFHVMHPQSTVIAQARAWSQFYTLEW